MTVNDFLAGSISGAAGVYIGYPLDTVKARLQTSDKYRGIVHCLLETLKHEKLRGIYKGVSAPAVSAGFQHSLLFAGYASTLHFLHPNEANVEDRKDLPLREIMFATFVGSVIQLAPTIPVEVVKTRLQVQTEEYSSTRARYHGPTDCMRQIFREHGVRGIYKGGSAMAVRDCFGNLFYLPVYETLHRVLEANGCSQVTAQLLAGGTAGSCSWMSICPLEVIKCRMQVSDQKVSIMDTAKEILKHDGVKGFFRGGLSIVLRAFPVNAAIFFIYEQMLLALQKDRPPSVPLASTAM